jgi:hypothetical protein
VVLELEVLLAALFARFSTVTASVVGVSVVELTAFVLVVVPAAWTVRPVELEVPEALEPVLELPVVPAAVPVEPVEPSVTVSLAGRAAMVTVMALPSASR